MNEKISVEEYINQLKVTVIRDTRLLETTQSRIFDEIFNIVQELIKQNIQLTNQIQQLKESDNEDQARTESNSNDTSDNRRETGS